MKRSPGSPGMRFEKLARSTQLQLQYNMADQQYYHGGVGASHLHYGRAPPMPSAAPGSYMYNPNPGLGSSSIPTRAWNCNVNVPPPRGPMKCLPKQLSTPVCKRITGHNATATSKSTTPIADITLPEDAQSVVNKQTKRKPRSSRYGGTKKWVREDAIKAIALEDEYSKCITKAPILLLRFPDPELNREIISEYSPSIESVHFQQNSAPRYCFVHLKNNADVDKTIETISKIPFGNGYVSAELKRVPPATPAPSNPEEVDPYTLYVGNLPTTISSRTVKEHFPSAHRIDIGFAQRMKYSRYAFVRYNTVEEAMDAFRKSAHTLIESRSLIVRFRRQKNTIASGEQVNSNDAHLAQEAEKDREQLNIPAANVKKSCDAPSGSKDETSPAATSADNDFVSPFVSSGSVEKPENIIIDSTEFEETPILREKLQQIQQSSNVSTARHSSLDEMFVELERRDFRLSNISSSKPSDSQATAGLRIKEEHNDNEDNSSEEDESPLPNLLGTRYDVTDVQVKKEPEEEPTTNQNPQNEHFEYDEEFDNESEEVEAENFPSAQICTNGGDRKPASWELRQQQLVNDKKPNAAQLQSPSAVAAKRVNEHSSLMKKLYEEVRRAKEIEKRKRPRDELDDIFAQMNSDTDDDNDLF